MATLSNPETPGSFPFQSVVYAAPGLNFTDPSLSDYQLYAHPAPDFIARRIDLSLFANFDASVPRPKHLNLMDRSISRCALDVTLIGTLFSQIP
jgi:hypothetical protein